MAIIIRLSEAPKRMSPLKGPVAPIFFYGPLVGELGGREEGIKIGKLESPKTKIFCPEKN